MPATGVNIDVLHVRTDATSFSASMGAAAGGADAGGGSATVARVDTGDS